MHKWHCNNQFSTYIFNKVARKQGSRLYFLTWPGFTLNHLGKLQITRIISPNSSINIFIFMINLRYFLPGESRLGHGTCTHRRIIPERGRCMLITYLYYHQVVQVRNVIRIY